MRHQETSKTIYESQAGDILYSSEVFKFEIIEDTSGSLKETKIKLTNSTKEKEIILLIRIDAFSEAVGIFRNEAANLFDHTGHSYSLEQEVRKLSKAFEPATPWED